MRRFTFHLLALFLLTSLRAEPVQPAKDKEPKPAKQAAAAHDKWTVDDVLLAATAGQFQFAPDGRAVVWVKTAMDKDKGERPRPRPRTRRTARAATTTPRRRCGSWTPTAANRGC